jgi:uncharacterized protein (DUF2141 family)
MQLQIRLRRETELKNSNLRIKQFALSAFLCCTLLAAATGGIVAQAQNVPAVAPAKSTLTIHINGLHSAKGRLNVALYRDGKGFPSDPASSVASQRLEIDPQTLSATAVFANVPQGAYAVSVMHDEDLTGKMEYDAQGIPQEGYGLSNNPDTSQGPPSPEQGTFKVNQPETTIEIKMVYWQ